MGVIGVLDAAVKWGTEPLSTGQAEAELALVEAEIEDLRARRRNMAELLLDLEADRKYLRQFIEHHAPAEEMEQA